MLALRPRVFSILNPASASGSVFSKYSVLSSALDHITSYAVIGLGSFFSHGNATGSAIGSFIALSPFSRFVRPASNPPRPAAHPAAKGTTEGLYAHAAAEELIQEREEALERMRRAGAIVLDVSPQVMTASVVNRYLELKARGAL